MPETIDTPERIETKIEELMRELAALDPDANLRLERLMARFRVERAVEKHCH